MAHSSDSKVLKSCQRTEENAVDSEARLKASAAGDASFRVPFLTPLMALISLTSSNISNIENKIQNIQYKDSVMISNQKASNYNLWYINIQLYRYSYRSYFKSEFLRTIVSCFFIKSG